MGAVYGRMNFNRFSNFNSPSKSRPQESARKTVASRRAAVEQSPILDSEPSPMPVSRRSSRRRSSNRPATLRRSARLNAPTGSMMVRGPAGLRRSARLARLAPSGPRIVHAGEQTQARRSGTRSASASTLNLVSGSAQSGSSRRHHGQMIPSMSRPVTRLSLRNQNSRASL